jgi:hypothetical protein
VHSIEIGGIELETEFYLQPQIRLNLRIEKCTEQARPCPQEIITSAIVIMLAIKFCSMWLMLTLRDEANDKSCLCRSRV